MVRSTCPRLPASPNNAKVLTYEVGRIVEVKLKSKYTLAAEEFLTDMLKTGYATASNNLKDASCQYSKNDFICMTSNGTLEDFFMKNLGRWSQTLEFMVAIT